MFLVYVYDCTDDWALWAIELYHAHRGFVT
jgi:hypothetical protein